jgi:hypothetical protein
MEQTAVQRFFMALQIRGLLPNEDFIDAYNQAKEMEKEQELKIKIICWKEALQLIDDNYMAGLINIRIYNMEQELLTFKSK